MQQEISKSVPLCRAKCSRRCHNPAVLLCSRRRGKKEKTLVCDLCQVVLPRIVYAVCSSETILIQDARACKTTARRFCSLSLRLASLVSGEADSSCIFVNQSVNLAGTAKDRHLYKWDKMEVKAVLLFLVIVIPASVAFQWTSSQIPDGSSFRACVGERAIFPWSFFLSPGEHVISVEWYRTTGKGQVIVAALVAGHFFPAAGQIVTFVPGAGLQVGHVSLAEFGTYSVRVNYNNNGPLLSSQQTAFLTMEDAPVLAEGQMVASLGPEPVLDDVTGRLHIQLVCGHFLSLGSRPVSVVWKTPSDHTVASTAYINGTFRLNLPHPTLGGRYYCHLKDPSVAARCIPNVSRLMRGAYIHVDEVQIRLTLLEGGLQGSQAKDEKLDREMDRQAALDSELQSREQNLTAEIGRLAEITHMLLTRTEKLTSDNERLTSDNEKLKTQTQKLTSDTKQLKTQTEKLTSDNQKLTTQAQKLTSDNEILKTQTGKLTSDNEKQKTQTQKLTSDNEQLKTQTQKLTSDNEKLKTQTQKLTSDNDGLKSQMQSMASQLTAETAKLSRRVDNMATNTSDMSTQLLALKSRSDVATKRVGFFARLNPHKTLNDNEILTSTEVITNEGGAFDGSTGKFTAPVSGTYFFLVNIITFGASKKTYNTGVYIAVDGFWKALAYSSHYSGMNITGSCHFLFRLTQGQKVWVQNEYGDTTFLSEYTFTGALLHPDLP